MDRVRRKRTPAAEHPPRHVCPEYCHPCPHLRGTIMPMCMGSAVSFNDEMDLTACTCRPNDPILGRAELGEFALRGLDQLRDWRRFRQCQKNLVERLRQVSERMSDVVIATLAPKERDAWLEVRSIANQLRAELYSRENSPQPSPEDLTNRRAEILREMATDYSRPTPADGAPAPLLPFARPRSERI